VPWDSKKPFLCDVPFPGRCFATMVEIPLWNPYLFRRPSRRSQIRNPLIFTPTMLLLALIAAKRLDASFSDAVILAHLLAGRSLASLAYRRRWNCIQPARVLAAIRFQCWAAPRPQGSSHTGIIISYSFFPAALNGASEPSPLERPVS